MDSLYALFGWGSPIGTGIFLVLLALCIYLLSRSGHGKNKK